MKWEYKVLTYDPGHEVEPEKDVLNDYGKEGWSLIAVRQAANGVISYYLGRLLVTKKVATPHSARTGVAIEG